jgi:chromosome partitioning protein
MTNSAPGLGWPEDAVPTADPASVRTAADADADAWLAEVARSREDAGISGYGIVGRVGALPDRYARRASRMGVGWPSESAPGRPATDSPPSARQDQLGEGQQDAGAGAEVGLGSSSGTEATGPVPDRVRQALASVSRETHELIGPEATSSPGLEGHRPGGEGPGTDEVDRDARRRGSGRADNDGSPTEGGQRGESEDQVAFPAVPDASADTPIARAAQAAVVARLGGEAWPRPSSCRIMTIANQKGGVGKTTTAVNLAASLAMHGARVLVVDLDPQGNASTALDVDHHSGIKSVYNVLVDGDSLSSVIRPVAGFPHLYCAPAAIDLAGAEIELVPLVARESRLARAVGGYDASNLDYIFIDCPPSLGLLTVNALVAAPEVLIPIQCEYYALEGLEQLLRTIELVRSHLNPGLAVTAILLTMYDGRTRLASQVADEVREHFGGVVLGPVIPRSVRVSEAPSYGQSVMTYDPGSTGALAYLEAARELALRNVQQPAT